MQGGDAVGLLEDDVAHLRVDLRQLAEEPKNATLLADALYEVTGRRLAVAFAVGEDGGEGEADDEPVSEDEFVSLFKDTFDAREIEE